jgi:uncharacterized Rossmann fold enzyme
VAKKTNTDKQDRIYITELAEIINRQPGTIRKWESSGILPGHLLPKRGYKGWRYWTHSQVHGARGIIAWMKRNDMRPGRTVTDPEKEAEHIANLRRPKRSYLTGHHVRAAKMMADNGRTSDYIVEKIHPRTRYSRPESTEAALRKMFKQNKWKWPRQRKKRIKVNDPLEKQVKKLIA